MNPYIYPLLVRKDFKGLSKEDKEKKIRKTIIDYYGFDCVTERYYGNNCFDTVENLGRALYPFLMRKYTPYSLKDIMRFMKLTDHASVIKQEKKFKGVVSPSRQEVLDIILEKLFA